MHIFNDSNSFETSKQKELTKKHKKHKTKFG